MDLGFDPRRVHDGSDGEDDGGRDQALGALRRSPWRSPPARWAGSLDSILDSRVKPNRASCMATA